MSNLNASISDCSWILEAYFSESKAFECRDFWIKCKSLKLMQIFRCKYIWIWMINPLDESFMVLFRQLGQFWDYVSKLEEPYHILISITDTWSLDLNCELEQQIFNWKSCTKSECKISSNCEYKFSEFNYEWQPLESEDLNANILKS